LGVDFTATLDHELLWDDLCRRPTARNALRARRWRDCAHPGYRGYALVFDRALVERHCALIGEDLA
jgi:hypothetical protein